MKIYPAIDLWNGACVRLKQGHFHTHTLYDQQPLSRVQQFIKAGAKYLHIVDLNGSKEGKCIHTKVIHTLVSETNLQVQVGGGIRKESDVAKLFNSGVERVIIGSLAVTQPEILEKWVKRWSPDRFVIAIDLQEDQLGKFYVTTHGWQEISSLTPETMIKNFRNSTGIQDYLCTDISKDGMLTGPNFSLYKSLICRFPKIRLIASGGISNQDDLIKINKIGCDSTIIGKAIYENHISLSDVLDGKGELFV